jgi:hypothetical protein
VRRDVQYEAIDLLSCHVDSDVHYDVSVERLSICLVAMCIVMFITMSV